MYCHNCLHFMIIHLVCITPTHTCLHLSLHPSTPNLFFPFPNIILFCGMSSLKSVPMHPPLQYPILSSSLFLRLSSVSFSFSFSPPCAMVCFLSLVLLPRRPQHSLCLPLITYSMRHHVVNCSCSNQFIYIFQCTIYDKLCQKNNNDVKLSIFFL